MPVPVRSPWLVALSLLSLVGCKEPADITDEVDAYGVTYDAIVGQYCGCYDSFGFATPDECRAAYGDFDPSVASCIVQAFEGREDVGEDYFACVVPVMEAFDECLLFDECGADGWHLECATERDAALAECPTLAAGLANEFATCLPGDLP